jgi:hypothetical protein
VGEVGGWGGGVGGRGIGVGGGVGGGGGLPDQGRRAGVEEDSPAQKSRDRNFSDDGAWQVCSKETLNLFYKKNNLYKRR